MNNDINTIVMLTPVVHLSHVARGSRATLTYYCPITP